jgi:hypothetical protein
MKEFPLFQPTDIDFHAKNSKNIESNPFEESDPRHNEWIECFNKCKKRATRDFSA